MAMEKPKNVLSFSSLAIFGNYQIDQEMEKGIETLKKHLGNVIEVAERVEDVFDDGKVGLLEWVPVAMKSIKLWKIARDFGELKAEVVDLDETEKEELIAFFVEELDFENNAAEHAIESIFSLLVSMAELLDVVKIHE